VVWSYLDKTALMHEASGALTRGRAGTTPSRPEISEEGAYEVKLMFALPRRLCGNHCQSPRVFRAHHAEALWAATVVG
jgi:hypothetical protein